MSEPTTIFGTANRMVEQEVARVAAEEKARASVEATWQRGADLQATAQVKKTWRNGWGLAAWAGWKRRPGPDEVAAGVRVDKEL